MAAPIAITVSNQIDGRGRMLGELGHQQREQRRESGGRARL
jgi:hypothetical protein